VGGKRYTSEAERALVAHYRDADEETEQLGTGWYRRSRLRWSSNVALAEALCAGKPVTGVLSANLEKAQRILDGERPLAVLGGDKVRAFYRAIMGDPEAVVLDVWMMRAAGWQKATLSKSEYASLSEALTSAAERVGLDPADFQAVVWTHVRGSGE
jgi:hypothetical protein